MPKKAQGWVTFQSSEEERKILEDYCQRSHRSKTDVLRELVRSLTQLSPNQPTQSKEDHVTTETVDEPPATKPLRISSRNVLKGKIKHILIGSVNSEVTLEVVHKVELVSIITQSSVEQLELTEGKEAYAVIKSSDVAIARD